MDVHPKQREENIIASPFCKGRQERDFSVDLRVITPHFTP
jgi:hypothetical protein